MTRLVRLLLACLLTLALPLQGLAAGFGLHCQGHAGQHAASGDRVGPGEHRGHASVHVDVHDDGHAHSHAHSHAQGHDHDGSSDGHFSLDAGIDPGHGVNVDADSGACSACATCCTAGAPPSRAVSLGDPPLQPAPGVRPPSSATPFLTGGPERPPRLAVVA